MNQMCLFAMAEDTRRLDEKILYIHTHTHTLLIHWRQECAVLLHCFCT